MLCSLGYLRFSVQPQQAGDSGPPAYTFTVLDDDSTIYWDELEELSIVFSIQSAYSLCAQTKKIWRYTPLVPAHRRLRQNYMCPGGDWGGEMTR